MANKTLTQVPVVLTDITSLTVVRDSGEQVMAYLTYVVRANTGIKIGGDRSVKMALTQPQKNALINFLTMDGLAAINAAEGT